LEPTRRLAAIAEAGALATAFNREIIQRHRPTNIVDEYGTGSVSDRTQAGKDLEEADLPNNVRRTITAVANAPGSVVSTGK
jgi:hypothetical protein